MVVRGSGKKKLERRACMGCKAGAAEGAFEANIADAALKLGREERGMVVRAWRKKKLERRA